MARDVICVVLLQWIVTGEVAKQTFIVAEALDTPVIGRYAIHFRKEAGDPNHMTGAASSSILAIVLQRNDRHRFVGRRYQVLISSRL